MGRLFWKFFFAFWLAVLTAGIGVGTAVWVRHNSNLLSSANEQDIIDSHASAFVNAAADILTHGGVSGLRSFLDSVQEGPFPAVYAVNDADQEILERSLSDSQLQQIRNLYLQQTASPALRMVSADDGHRYLLFAPWTAHGLRGNRHQPPPDELGGGPPPDIPRHPRPGRRPPPWLAISAGTLASLMFSALLAWYFAKPIRKLRSAFAALAGGALDTRIGMAMGRRSDELTELGRDFDHMAQQICALVSAQRHLLHDVSHELRSPLARIQAAIGLAQQQPEKLAASMERIERETQRMNQLVGELLMLSRLEAGVDAEKISHIDIGDLLADIIADVQFEAEPLQVGINYKGPNHISGQCRSELLHRAIENVLRNAVQHCQAGGQVQTTVHFDARQRRLRIGIDDDGPGVPEQHLAAIFQPFFRSTPRDKNGAGLGLAIAYRAIAAQGGDIQARNRRGGGLRVIIELPLPA